MNKTYTTTLETMEHDVGAILAEKFKATSPQATVDYVAFAIDNIDANIERAKQAKKDLDAYIKDMNSKKEAIKIGTADFLKDNGVDKLAGMRISSLTTYTPAPKEELVIHINSYWMENPEFTKTSLDTTAIKNFLKSSEIDYSEYAEIKTTHLQDTIKVNKRKG